MKHTYVAEFSSNAVKLWFFKHNVPVPNSILSKKLHTGIPPCKYSELNVHLVRFDHMKWGPGTYCLKKVSQETIYMIRICHYK